MKRSLSALLALPVLLSTGFSASSVTAAAPAGQVQKVIRVVRQMIPVPINAQSVLCSAADYQEPMLKILIPALAPLTLLNHRNTRAGAPCVAAGACTETLNPDTILKGGSGTDTVPVEIIDVQTLTPVPAQNLCTVTLTEMVRLTIRGLPFVHVRSTSLGNRVLEDCQ